MDLPKMCNELYAKDEFGTRKELCNVTFALNADVNLGSTNITLHGVGPTSVTGAPVINFESVDHNTSRDFIKPIRRLITAQMTLCVDRW